ncbi:MAG: hypothetical protein ABW185_07170 [Sedimenticola sp.]
MAEVTVSRTTKNPPNSVTYVTCDDEMGAASFVVESTEKETWLIPIVSTPKAVVLSQSLQLG